MSSPGGAAEAGSTAPTLSSGRSQNTINTGRDWWFVVILLRHYGQLDVRPVEGQYHVNTTSIWELIPRELNGNILKFFSAKEVVRFKMGCKNAKSAVESEKGLLFDAIRMRLDMIIDEHGLESVPNAFNFKVKNCIRLLAFYKRFAYHLRGSPLAMAVAITRWEPTTIQSIKY